MGMSARSNPFSRSSGRTARQPRKSSTAQVALSAAFTLSPETLVFCLVIYGFIASVLPVWMLLAPRDYLSTFMKVGVIALLAAVLLAAYLGLAAAAGLGRAQQLALGG